MGPYEFVKLAQAVSEGVESVEGVRCLLRSTEIVDDPMSATGHYGVACLGAPDASARQNGFKLGARVAELVKKLHQ